MTICLASLSEHWVRFMLCMREIQGAVRCTNVYIWADWFGRVSADCGLVRESSGLSNTNLEVKEVHLSLSFSFMLQGFNLFVNFVSFCLKNHFQLLFHAYFRYQALLQSFWMFDIKSVLYFFYLAWDPLIYHFFFLYVYKTTIYNKITCIFQIP